MGPRLATGTPLFLFWSWREALTGLPTTGHAAFWEAGQHLQRGAAGLRLPGLSLVTVTGLLPILGQLPPQTTDECPYKNNSESVPVGSRFPESTQRARVKAMRKDLAGALLPRKPGSRL